MLFASFPNASSSWFLSLPQRVAADSLPNSSLNACKEEQLSREEPGSLQDFQEKDLPSKGSSEEPKCEAQWIYDIEWYPGENS